MVSGSEPGVPRIPFGQCHTVIQAEQVGFVGIAVLDQDHDVVDRRGELGWNQVECVGDQLVKPLRAHPHGHAATAPAVAVAAAGSPGGGGGGAAAVRHRQQVQAARPVGGGGTVHLAAAVAHPAAPLAAAVAR